MGPCASLAFGTGVVISADALSHARLPHGRFAYGGADYDKLFLLDENDRKRADRAKEAETV